VPDDPRGLESTSSRMTRLGKGSLTDTRSFRWMRLAERIEAVTSEQVLHLLRGVPPGFCCPVVVIGADEAGFTGAVRPRTVWRGVR